MSALIISTVTISSITTAYVKLIEAYKIEQYDATRPSIFQ